MGVPLFDKDGNVYTVLTASLDLTAFGVGTGQAEGIFLVDLNGDPLVIDSTGAASVNQRGFPTATCVSVTMSASDQTILAANTARAGATFQSKSANNILLRLGAAATTSVYTVIIAAGKYWELPFGYTGVVHAIGDAFTPGDAVLVTEITT